MCILTYFSLSQISLVTDDHEGEAGWFWGVSLHQELLKPVTERREGGHGAHVEQQEATMCSSVQGITQGLEPLGACSVPDLPQGGGRGNLPTCGLATFR